MRGHKVNTCILGAALGGMFAAVYLAALFVPVFYAAVGKCWECQLDPQSHSPELSLMFRAEPEE